jgi:hypothetical protein
VAAALAEDRQATEASADFTAFIRLTVFHQLIVGKFYNSPRGEMPLTIAFGLPERVNPVGTRFASMQASWRRRTDDMAFAGRLVDRVDAATGGGRW